MEKPTFDSPASDSPAFDRPTFDRPTFDRPTFDRPTFDSTADTARALDAADELAELRNRFAIPRRGDGSEEIYFAGNSLGLAPKSAIEYAAAELDRWASLAVRGHFEGEHPWMPYHRSLAPTTASLVGALESEVVVMNALTVNLHLLMASFYRPTSHRFKILVEDHAFPSDHFAVASQIRHRGFDPAVGLVTVAPRPGEDTLRADDIAAAVAAHGNELALVLLPGIQYYTGQVLPMHDIVSAAHAVGAFVGLDLAHAIGNIDVALHDWGPDFAVWCNYKYVNGGPGTVGGCFVHQRHHGLVDLPRYEGWWGTDPATRFEMRTEFSPIPTAEAWQLSNAPILQMAVLRAALEVFDAAGGMKPLIAKSRLQVAYLDHLLDDLLGERVETITPRAMVERGCQFSLRLRDAETGPAVFRQLEAAGVACDWRHPDVIRVAPVPLYNTFADIHGFATTMRAVVAA